MIANSSTSPPLLPAPLVTPERIQEIDIIRGFALFGVLWLNLVAHGYNLVPTGTFDNLETARFDTVFARVADLVISNKAMALFSLLFGYGFAMIINRLELKGHDASIIFLRRISILFGIGLIHIWLIWFGDILHVYALMGFMLLVTRRWSDRTLLLVGLFFALFSTSLVEIFLLIQNQEVAEVSIFEIGAKRHYQVIQGGSYTAYLGELWWASWNTMWGDVFYINYCLTALGRFMLGAWIYRQGWLQSAATKQPEFRRAAIVLIGAGIIFTLLGMVIVRSSELLAYLFDPLTQLTLAVGYAAGIVTLCQSHRFPKVMISLAAVGRTALTNYLLQSVMYLFVLFGFGFGLITQLGATLCFIIAVAFFALQMVVSTWWVRRYRFGPMEWLWRSLTYKKLQPFRLE